MLRTRTLQVYSACDVLVTIGYVLKSLHCLIKGEMVCLSVDA